MNQSVLLIVKDKNLRVKIKMKNIKKISVVFLVLFCVMLSSEMRSQSLSRSLVQKAINKNKAQLKAKAAAEEEAKLKAETEAKAAAEEAKKFTIDTPILFKRIDINGKQFDLLDVKIQKEEGSKGFLVDITSPKGRLIRTWAIDDAPLNETIKLQYNYSYILIRIKSMRAHVPCKGTFELSLHTQ